MAEIFDTADKIKINVPSETAKLPTKGRLGLEDALGISRPYQEARAGMLPEISAAESAAEKGKQAQSEILAGGKEKAVQDFATAEKTAKETYQGKLEAEPLPAFIPTKDTAQDLASLFSLVNVIGMAVGGGGKQSAQQAMYAMNGMLEGYQKGRADLYKKEKESFDKNFKAMQESVKTLEKDYEEAVKMYQYDKEAGEIARKLALARSGSPLFKAMEDRVGMVGTLNAIKELRTSVDKGVVLQNNLQKTADDRRLKEENLLLKQINAENKAAKVPAANRQGQNALTFASRQYGNIANAVQDLKNMQMLPATAQSPTFAGMIGVDPNTALSSISALAARTITSKEEKAFEQITNSLDAALSRLEAQGLASGATKAAIQSFNSLKPRKGDSAINMALYIARVKQEIQTGIDVHSKMPGATPEQKDSAKAMLGEINRVVPFDVDTVLDTLRKNRKTLDSKIKGLLQTPTISSGIQMPKDLPPEPAAPVAAPVSKYDSAETVKNDYRTGKISKEQATSILVDQFGYKP
jgi:hypothetical protein